MNTNTNIHIKTQKNDVKQHKETYIDTKQHETTYNNINKHNISQNDIKT